MSSIDPQLPPQPIPPDAFSAAPLPSADGLSTILRAHPPRKPYPPHPNVGWALVWCIGFLLFTQVPAALAITLAVVILLVLRSPSLPEGPVSVAELMQSPGIQLALQVGFLLGHLLALAFSCVALHFVAGRDWPRQLAVRAPGVLHTLLTVASFPAVVLLANGVYFLLREVLHVPSISDSGLPGMEEMTHVFSGWLWPMAILLIGVGPALSEELWCRGFLGRGLVGCHGWVLGILFASFYFGLIHVDPCQGGMAALLGIWLHYVYRMGRSLWLPILLHFLNNAFAVTVSRFETLKRVEEQPASLPLLLYGAAALLLVAVGWALAITRARLVPDGSGPALWRPPFAGVAYPPPESGTRVLRTFSLPATLVVTGAFAVFVACCMVAFRE